MEKQLFKPGLQFNKNLYNKLFQDPNTIALTYHKNGRLIGYIVGWPLEKENSKVVKDPNFGCPLFQILMIGQVIP